METGASGPTGVSASAGSRSDTENATALPLTPSMAAELVLVVASRYRYAKNKDRLTGEVWKRHAYLGRMMNFLSNKIRLWFSKSFWQFKST